MKKISTDPWTGQPTGYTLLWSQFFAAKIAEYDKSREIVKERAQSGSRWPRSTVAYNTGFFHNSFKITNIEAIKVRTFCMVVLDLELLIVIQ